MLNEFTDQIAYGLGEELSCEYGASIFEELLKEDEEKSLFEEVDEKIEQMKENLTIPQNTDDKVESELYKKLEKNYDHADRIVRWYRNEKKNGTEENELKATFIDNLENIKDLFKTYEQYVDSLKKMKMLNKKVELNGKQFDVVKDIDKIRRLDGFRNLVKSMGDMIHSDSTIETTNQKYAITDEDRKKIRLIGFTENVMCWCTEGYETTNKFIYQLWQNSKTLGRGDVYGDKSEQTPYCTHSKQHWDDYSERVDRYQQYWYLERFDNRMNVSYDIMLARNRNGAESQDEIKTKDEEFKNRIKNLKLSVGDLNNKDVVGVFNLMKGLGSHLLIAMNDTNGDFLDSEDGKFDDFKELNHGKEVQQLDNELFDKDIEIKINVGGKDIILKNDRTVRVKGEKEKGYTEGDIVIRGTVRDYYDIETLEGCPEDVKGRFEITNLSRVTSLKGCPKTVSGQFIVFDTPIESMEYCPRVSKDTNANKRIAIGETKVKNFKGIDSDFDGRLDFSNNELTSFEGIPKKCKWLEVSDENLDTLNGLPEKIISLDLSLPKLKTLDYAPKNCKYFSLTDNNNISFDERDEYKKYREVMNLLEALAVNYGNDDKKLQQQATEIIQRINYWYNIHTMSDGKHYKQSGPTQLQALTMDINELKKLAESTPSSDISKENETLNESEFDSLVNEVEDEIDDMKDYQRFESLLETDVSDYDVPFSDISIDDDSIRNSECNLNAYSVQVPTDNDSMAYNPKTNPDKAIDIILKMPNANVEIFLDTDSREWDSWINGNEGKLSPEQMEKFFNTDFYNRICNKLDATWPNEDETFGRLLEATKIKKYKTNGYVTKEEIDEETDVFSRLNKDKDKSREKNAAGDQIRTRSGRKIITPSDFLVTHDDNEAYAVWPEKGKEFKWSQWADWEKIHIFARIRFKMGQYVYGGSLTPFVEDNKNRGFKFYNLDLEPKLQYLTPEEAAEMMKLSIVKKFTKHAIKHIQKYINISDEELFKKIGRPEKCTLDGIRKTKQIMKNTMKALRENRADTYIYT